MTAIANWFQSFAASYPGGMIIAGTALLVAAVWTVARISWSLEQMVREVRENKAEQKEAAEKAASAHKAELKETSAAHKNAVEKAAIEHKRELKETSAEHDRKLEKAVDGVKAEIKDTRTELQAEIKQTRKDLDGKIERFRAELKTEIREFKEELKGDIKEVRQSVLALGKRMDDLFSLFGSTQERSPTVLTDKGEQIDEDLHALDIVRQHRDKWEPLLTAKVAAAEDNRTENDISRICAPFAQDEFKAMLSTEQHLKVRRLAAKFRLPYENLLTIFAVHLRLEYLKAHPLPDADEAGAAVETPAAPAQ